MLSIIFISITSYLAGSFPSGIIVSRLWKGIDIREHGSKNPGATNVFRVIGPVPGIIVLLLDIGKGLFAVLLLSQILSGQSGISQTNLKIIVGIAAIIGHSFPLFASFKGGKGVATGLGVMLAIAPLETALALVLFSLIVAFTRYISLGSLSAALFLLLALVLERYYLVKPVAVEVMLMVLVLNIYVFYTHRSNIKRLLKGTENRFGRKTNQKSI